MCWIARKDMMFYCTETFSSRSIVQSSVITFAQNKGLGNLSPGKKGEEVLAVAFNPTGSLVAVASSFRISVWSGGKDHVPLGSVALSVQGLPGASLLWRPDSGVLAVISTTGKLSLVSVRRKASARPVGERLVVPDWFEPQDPQHARIPSDDDGGVGEVGGWKDMWADPTEAILSLTAAVDKISSEISAMCLGRFGQHVLVGTTDGELFGVSWEGQILCRYAIVALTTAPALDSNEDRGCPRTAPGDTRLLDACATSMMFNDTLQLLALTTDDGSFFLGALSKVSCYLRKIDITEQARAYRPTAPTTPGAPVSHVSSPLPVGNPPEAGPVDVNETGWARPHTQTSGDAGAAPGEPTRSGTRDARNSWGGWSLWEKGKGAVAAAAAVAADVISSATGPSLNPDTFGAGVENIPLRRPTEPEAPGPDDDSNEGKDAGGETYATSGEGEHYTGAAVDDPNHAAGAVAVEFSTRGCLMAVALFDGTVLLTRVERYTSGVRARHKLQISNTMLQKTDSYTLQVASDEIPESTGEEVDDGTSRPSATSLSREASELDGQASLEGRPRSAVFNLQRSSSISALWGVEVHQLHCLSLHPWLGSGESRGRSAVGGDVEATRPAGAVLSMCFSFDGGALAVGHEGALTIWSTEDGSRLVSTVSHAYKSGSRGTPGSAHLRAVSETPSQLNGGADHAHDVYNDVSGNGGETGALEENIMSPARSTLDLVAGGARSLTWECEGYRLLSVTGQGVVRGAHASSGEGMAAPGARDGEAQNIVAFDFFRRARSNLSSALLTMQGPDRIALVDSQPWSAQVLLWRVLPVHPGYLSSNAPLRHVSTSRAGTYVAVAGARGLAVYSRPMNKWRLFGNIEQEREVQVAGMCWWGESALVVASRLKHGFILLMYSRKHLDSQSLLLPPIKLPVGMRPLFMQDGLSASPVTYFGPQCGSDCDAFARLSSPDLRACVVRHTGLKGVQEGGSRSGSDVLFLLVAGSTSYLLYRFSCEKNLGEGGSSVSYTVLHEGTLPHVLENMADMRPLDQRVAVEPPLESPEVNATNEEKQQHEQPSEEETKFTATTNGVHESGDAGNHEVGHEGSNGIATRESGDGEGNPEQLSSEDNDVQPQPQPQPVVGGEGKVGVVEKGAESGPVDYTGPGTPVPAVGLPEIGPPKRVMLLPEVHPRSIALLDYDGNLVTMELSNGEVKAVAEGVESIVDLTGVSEVWEALETPLLIHPCYLLRRKARVSSDWSGGRGSPTGSHHGHGTDNEEVSEEYSVWCPAMRLDPMPQSVKRLLSPGDTEPLSPVLSLDPGASCDPERVDLGLQPLLGTMVHVSQVVCCPRLWNTPPLPPCYELRTHLRPIVHMVLRHLLIVSQLQLLNSPLPNPGEPGLATELVADRVPERVPARESDVTITPASLQQCIQQQREQREQRAEVTRVSTSAGAPSDGKDEAGVDTSAQEEEQDEERRRCDWVGTSSDAFEIAVCVLKRCREDAVLVEALPDTLELLIRACMEALRLAGDRARSHVTRNKAAQSSRRDASVSQRGASTSTSTSASTTLTESNVPPAISELELARAVMADCVYIAQLAPDCFHEVIARVARKAEPESYGFLFPLHLVCYDGDNGGPAGSVRSVNESPSKARRWAHPTHLFDQCISRGKLTTAAWFLPLVRDDVVHKAAQRHASPEGPLSDEERESIMPLEMWGVTGDEWPFGLSHALACVLLAESLISKQYAFLPEVWLFARKREQSTPHHRDHQNKDDYDKSAQTGVVAGAVKSVWRQQPQQAKLVKTQSQSDGATGRSRTHGDDVVFSNDRRSRESVFLYHTPWWRRGEGAVLEARMFEVIASHRAAMEASARRRRRSSSLGGNGFDASGLPATRQDSVPGSHGMLSSAGESIASTTLFGQRTALRLRALEMPGRPEAEVLGRREEGKGRVERDNGESSVAAASRDEHGASSSERADTVSSSQPADSERTRLYHLPFSRDAASVVSRFLWKQLNELRVKVVIKSFQALASSPAAREAGLHPEVVLGALSPARRSMVGSQRRSPEEMMAGLTVALAEMFKVGVEDLSLLAVPLARQDHTPLDGDSNTPVAVFKGERAAQQGVPESEPLIGEGSAGGDRNDGSPYSYPEAVSVSTAEADGTKGEGARQADDGRNKDVSVSLRKQLELLGRLCRAIGHGEGALVCATLLRNELAVMGTLSNASQTLRVGYGKFVSDLEKQLSKARDLVAPTANTMLTPEQAHGNSKANVGQPEFVPLRAATGAASFPSQPAGLIEIDSGDKQMGPGSSDNRAHVRAAALLGLQRFGGQCVRNLAEGAVFA